MTPSCRRAHCARIIAGIVTGITAGAVLPSVLVAAPVVVTGSPAARAAGLPVTRSSAPVPLGAFPAPGDQFGAAVAISGSIAIVGARGVHSAAGAAYTYVRSGGTWRRHDTLTDPGRANGDTFGDAVAISGSTAIVGAPGTNGVAGTAYIYVRSGLAWHLQAALADPGATSYDYFGGAVAISGGTVVVGAVNANNLVGAAYIYQRSGGTWHRKARLTLPGGGSTIEFGGAVAISGGTVLVGAPGAFNGIGAAYVYAHSGAGWHLQARWLDPATTGDGQFGIAVALAGPTARATAIVGAVDSVHPSGVAWVYARSDGRWRRQARLGNPGGRSGDNFGTAIALSQSASGLRAVIGAPFAGRHLCGAAYDFARSGRTWRDKEQVVNPRCTVNAYFGMAVALAGRTAFIGAPNTDKSAGTVYVLTIR